MKTSFWDTIEKPLFVLAPMADVTDAAFRRIIASTGKPDALWTEFVSADGLFLGGREALEKDLLYSERERPIVAQFFSRDPKLMERAARLAKELGFDGVDINMGCPAEVICKQGAGAAIIKDPSRAQEIVLATKEGAGGRDAIPVSVKTRTGYNTEEIDTWIPALLETKPRAITIHARTKKEMSKVPAHWESISRAVEIRNEKGSGTLILGNGDINDLRDARMRVIETGCDGVMVGRGIFGNPWFFVGLSEFKNTKEEDLQKLSPYTPTLSEKIETLIEHAELFEELLGGAKPFVLMKKHFKAYINGFVGAKELRMELMESQNTKEVRAILTTFLEKNNPQ